MALQMIHSRTQGARTVKVFRDSDWEEFRVRLYIHGVLYPAADYYTDSKSDAMETAAIVVQA